MLNSRCSRQQTKNCTSFSFVKFFPFFSIFAHSFYSFPGFVYPKIFSVPSQKTFSPSINSKMPDSKLLSGKNFQIYKLVDLCFQNFGAMVTLLQNLIQSLVTYFYFDFRYGRKKNLKSGRIWKKHNKFCCTKFFGEFLFIQLSWNTIGNDEYKRKQIIWKFLKLFWEHFSSFEINYNQL